MDMSSSPTKGVAPSVKDWLEREGYRLEFEAALRFTEAGFSKLQATHLPGTDGNFREVDLVASKYNGKTLNGKRTRLRTEVIVECKYTNHNPWVLLGNEHVAASDLYDKIPQNDISEEDGPERLDLTGDEVLEWTRYSSGLVAMKPGQSTSQKPERGNGNDVPFQAMQKVSDIALSLAKARCSASRQKGVYFMAWPVIVIDGPLCRAWMSKSTKRIAVKEVDKGVVVWNGTGSPCRIDVVTRKALSRYAKRLFDEQASFYRWLQAQGTVHG